MGNAARYLIGGWGGVLIPIGALVSTLSAANANVLGLLEIVIRLAADRQIPSRHAPGWRVLVTPAGTS